MNVRELFTTLGFKVDESGAKQYEQVFDRLKRLAIAAAVAIGGTELIKSIIETTSAWQQENLQLSYIIGNVEKAHGLMLQLNELASRSPFTREELAGYAKQLINFGFGVNEITPLMGRLANIAAVLGKENIPLITESLARMKQRGYADARVMMELFHAGIPIQEELAKRFGVTTFQMNRLIQEGRVGFRDVYQALTDLTTGTGKFSGAAEANARTMGGLWKNVQHIIEDLKTTLGTSLLPLIQQLLTAFRDWLDVNKGHLADDMIKLLNTIAYVLGWIVGRVQDLLISLGLLPNQELKNQAEASAASTTARITSKTPEEMARGNPLQNFMQLYNQGPQSPAGRLPSLSEIERGGRSGNLTIHNETHLSISSSGPVDVPQMQKAVEDATAKGITKAIRQAAPSFAGANQ